MDITISKSDLHPHSRSLAIMSFDRSYKISYYSSIVAIVVTLRVLGWYLRSVLSLRGRY